MEKEQKQAKTKRKKLAVSVPSSSTPFSTILPMDFGRALHNQLSQAPWPVLGLALAPSTSPPRALFSFENGKGFSEVVGGSGRHSNRNQKTKEKELTRSFCGHALPSWAVSSSAVASLTSPSTVVLPAYPSWTTPQS